MLLRDHPLMMYNGIRSWPPVWVWKGGNDNTNPKGEGQTELPFQVFQRRVLCLVLPLSFARRVDPSGCVIAAFAVNIWRTAIDIRTCVLDPVQVDSS